jgi:penicillin-binding protein 2
MKLGRGQDTKDLRPRLVALTLVFLSGLLVLAGNLYRLMVVRYEEFLALSVDNQFKDVRVRAPRGLLRDRRGEILVDSRPSFDAFITPAFCQKCSTEVLPRLALYLTWDEDRRKAVAEQIRLAHGPQRYQPLAVQVDLSRDQFDLLSAHQFYLPGVDLEPVPHRNYRLGTSLAHVLGYMNEVTQEELTRLNGTSEFERPPYALGDYVGRRGIERSFESALRGSDGWVKQVVDARGQVMRDLAGAVMERDVVPASSGNNLVLSIDARLQAEAERAFPGQAGAVVVMEVNTGFLLAVVSRPAFDPNEMTGRVSLQRLAHLNRDPLQPMVFRAGAEHYHPGSIFKPITMLAALQAGAFTPQTAVVCPGGYSLGARRWRCHRDRGHGVVHAKTALQWSCDTYFYRASDLMGIEPIARVGKAFGLGSVTDFGVAAEVSGVMPDSEYHDRVTPGGYQKGMALNTAIGQGDVNVTPLQMAVMYAALGNGGRIYRPQVVKHVETPEGKVVRDFAPVLVRTVPVSPEHQRVVLEALVAVVNEPGGTALRARLPDVTIAGKTGTAQVARLGSVRVRKEAMDYFERDHAWFVAFAPAEAPEIVVAVLNEHGGHGGTDASPTAAAIFKKYFELRRADAATAGMAYQPPKPPPPIHWAAATADGGVAAAAAAASPDPAPPPPEPAPRPPSEEGR